jgi:hypothetical protein
MSSFSAQATVLGYEVDTSNQGHILAHYLIQDSVYGFNGPSNVSVAVDQGDSAHDIRQAVSAAVQTNPGTSQVNGSINIVYLV